MTTSPDSVGYPVQDYGLLAPLPAYVINLQDVPGADPTGNDDSTDALQDALDSLPASGGTLFIAPGTYKFSRTLDAQSNTTIEGPGTIKAAPAAEWTGGRYRGISNVNWEADFLTDENITIRNITIDMTDAGNSTGREHGIYLRRVSRVRIENVTVLGGASAIALLGCDDTLAQGCTTIGFRNCGIDHWDNPRNAVVIGNYLETTVSNQMVNFNPEPSSVLGTGHVADGFTMTGNTLVSSEAEATPCQIEPLATGNTVKNVTITGNAFKNSYLVLRGDTQGLTVTGNTFSDFQGATPAIYVRERFGVQAKAAILTGNTIRDPLTASPAEAVIVAESDSAIVSGNTIIGTGYTSAPIATLNSDGQVFGNFVDGTVVAGRLQGGIRLLNGSGSFWGWTDTGDRYPRMFLQTDNNWRWVSTDSAGADRSVASLAARSSTSELRWSVPILFSGSYTRRTPATVSAAGTTISGATVLVADINNVSTCTAGVADGVSLNPVDGQMQIVINTSAATLKVYPNNSGSAQIDNGGASVPTTILAGKSKTFTRVATGDFRTVSAT